MNFDTTYMYRMPTKVYYGFHSMNKTAAEAKIYGAKKAFVVTDKGLMAAGVVAPVLKNLEENNIPYFVFDEVDPDPNAQTCMKGADLIKAEGCDFIVCVGGGSPICAAKGIAVAATNPGELRQYAGNDNLKNDAMRMICVPTTAGSGSEVSAATVIHGDANDSKTFTINHISLFPAAAILDPIVLRGLPPMPFLFAAMDSFVHAIESLYTINATPFTDAAAFESIRMMIENMPKAAYSDDMEAKGLQQIASVMANFACGNAKLGLVHGSASPLGSQFHIPHGMGLGIMLPHVMEYNLPVAEANFARLADYCGWSKPNMGRLEKAKAAIEAVRDFLDLIEFPDRIPEDKIPKTEIPRMVQIALKVPQAVTLNKRKPNAADLEKIYLKAYNGRR